MNPNETNSVLQTKSRYVAGGVTEVNSKRLEWWERSTFDPDPTDVMYVVERRFEGRLDLIAAQYLGDSKLWWFIAQYNRILDVYGETVEGRTLYIPTGARVQSMLSGALGGYPSTREVPTNYIFPIV